MNIISKNIKRITYIYTLILLFLFIGCAANTEYAAYYSNSARTAVINYNQGVEHALNLQFEQAVLYFTKAIEQNSTYAHAYANRGFCYARMNLKDQAMPDYIKAIEIDSKNITAYINRGAIYSERGQHDQAISDYSKVIEIDPNHVTAHSNRGANYDYIGLYDQAISDYSKAISLSDYSKATHPSILSGICSNRGITYMHKGLFENAISDFDKAIEIYPAEIISYYRKGDVCKTLGRVNEAIQNYKEFIQRASSAQDYLDVIEIAKKKLSELEN